MPSYDLIPRRIETSETREFARRADLIGQMAADTKQAIEDRLFEAQRMGIRLLGDRRNNAS